MGFCSNCGKELPLGVKFCPNCGANTNESQLSNKREEAFIGKVVKCPNCGAEIPSFTTHCPSCGFELNSIRVNESIKDFTEKIHELDKKIAENPNSQKTGWATWGILKKFGWIILNFYTVCIPLIIYSAKHKKQYIPEEEQKKAFIKNYTFPNERESILEALMYIKSQLQTILDNAIDKDSFKWAKVWKEKAVDLKTKVDYMFKEDRIANNTYMEIENTYNSISKNIWRKEYLPLIIFGIFCLICFLAGAISALIGG